MSAVRLVLRAFAGRPRAAGAPLWVPDGGRRLAAGNHGVDSDEHCAMERLSVLGGEPVTAFPTFTARPLARMVHRINDALADDQGRLSQRDSATAISLGHRATGSRALSDAAAAQWAAQLLDAATSTVMTSQPTTAAVRQVVVALQSSTAGTAGPEWEPLRHGCERAAWSASTRAEFALADAGAYACWLDLEVVAARTATAVIEHAGPQVAADFTRWAIDAWHAAAAATPASPAQSLAPVGT